MADSGNRTQRLTARFVETVTEPGRYGDGGRGSHGLILNVHRQATGRISRSWIQRIRINGRHTHLGLGAYPVVTLAGARATALANRRDVANGIDPRTGGVPTFAEALDAVLAVRRGAWRDGGKSERQWRASLRDHAGPLMRKPLDAIGSDDVLKVLAPKWNTRRETMRRVKQRIGQVMQWGIAGGHVAVNPVDALGAALPTNGARRVHHRALPHADVNGALLTVDASNAWWATKAAFRFITLTAARSGEVRGMTWDELDMDAAVWTVPGDRMKAGKPHRVPLSEQAMAVLAKAGTLRDGSGLCFPSQSGRIMSDNTISKLLRELGIPSTVHGMRSSFRDWCAETGKSRELAEAALAHTVGGVEGAYFRSDVLDRRRALMEAWARYVERQSADVISLASA